MCENQIHQDLTGVNFQCTAVLEPELKVQSERCIVPYMLVFNGTILKEPLS
jgi:hypothetical protein